MIDKKPRAALDDITFFIVADNTINTDFKKAFINARYRHTLNKKPTKIKFEKVKR